ncbi:MAG: non-heme iron oxygenase ferredoxin subunit [Chloroflexi bacterium]|nr:non-heme iron oxygenase ferredoxin subunit [Chloroflexota bacterium]
MEAFVKVAKVSDLSPGQMMLVQVGDERILLSNLEGQFYAIGEECTHAYGPLSEGELYRDTVECPFHGSQFNLKSGEVIRGPAEEPLLSYSVRLEGDDILIGPL